MSSKLAIAMSGGVDSSVAAYIMRSRGYDCVGTTMLLFSQGGGESEPSSDAEDARRVSEGLGMQHFVFDLSERFKREVIDRFVDAYTHGRTPNPCVDCNRYLKFGELFAHAAALGCDGIVTGHYARVCFDRERGRYLLKKALDPAKDQSYVLYSLTQGQLARTFLPLGELTKRQVRDIAERCRLVNASKRDSQDICFVKGESYAAFIERNVGKPFPRGRFIDMSGNTLGMHEGIIRYTVGQRRGIGLSFPQPMYVCAIDAPANTVTLGDRSALFSRELTAVDVNLISVEHLRGPMRVTAKIRYRAPEQRATAAVLDDGTLKVVFDEPQRAVTSGQAVVLYDGDVVVGGGTIV